MLVDPNFFWKNFRLGSELQISGTFIYNALYCFEQMEHFDSEDQIFEFLYNLSVGIERLQKIAIIILEHDETSVQVDFEKSLITHNHTTLLERIKNNADIRFERVHNRLLNLVAKFYGKMRYDRFILSSAEKSDAEKEEFLDFIRQELNIEIQVNNLFCTPNDARIKRNIGKIVGRISNDIYQIIVESATKQNMYIHEIRSGSKAYKIFISKDYTFEEENLFRKEILLYLLKSKSHGDGFYDFIENLKELPLENEEPSKYVMYLMDFQNNSSMLDEFKHIYQEEHPSKQRLNEINRIGSDFGFNPTDESWF